MYRLLISIVIGLIVFSTAKAMPPEITVGSEFLVIVGSDSCVYCPQLVAKFKNGPMIKAALRDNQYVGVYYLSNNSVQSVMKNSVYPISIESYQQYINYYKPKSYPTVVRMKRLEENRYTETGRFEGNRSNFDIIRFLNKQKIRPLRNIISPIIPQPQPNIPQPSPHTYPIGGS